MTKRDQGHRGDLREIADALPFARDQREVAYKTAADATDETARAMLDTYQRLTDLLPRAHAALDTLDVELGRVPAQPKIESDSFGVVCIADLVKPKERLELEERTKLLQEIFRKKQYPDTVKLARLRDEIAAWHKKNSRETGS